MRLEVVTSGKDAGKVTPALKGEPSQRVDLLTVAEQRYYHPRQEGSWSIKKVLRAIAPDQRYDKLTGVAGRDPRGSVHAVGASRRTAKAPICPVGTPETRASSLLE